MKRLSLLIFGFLCTQMLFAQGFDVTNAEFEIHINPDGYFDVVEKYDVYFTQEKHGIFRNIQTNYDMINAEGKREKRRIYVSKIKVPGHKSNTPMAFMRDINDDFDIRIGKESQWVSGPVHYEIRYRVENAFLIDENSAQFYWNLKAGNWIAPFQAVQFKIVPPEGVVLSEDDFFVYSGQTGTTSESNAFEVRYENGAFIGNSIPEFQSNYGESVTVLLKMPAGAVVEKEPLWPFWSENGWALILGIGVFMFYQTWRKHGKDDRVIATISYFPPKDIHPSMAGFLIDDKADTHDLISLIPYWGSNGIIRVEEIPKKGLFGKADTRLIKLKGLPSNAPSYERQMFDGLFRSLGDEEETVLISSLKEKFHTTMSLAKTSLKSESQIYYDQDARKMKNEIIGAILLGGIACGALFLFTWGLFAALAVIPVAIILLLLAPYMEKKNSEGNEVLSDLKGFKQFIRVAEENKLKMLLKEDPEYFEKTMAYAVSFGLFSQWAKKFSSLNVQPPQWYSSPMGVYTMHSFSNSFSDSLRSTQTTMVSTPSSSGSGGGGGGMSGGGFGGGGGGSW